jgi:hypothetical protein
MQKRKIRGPALLSAAFLALSLTAPLSNPAQAVDGIEQRKNVTELTKQITWFDNMPQALASARQKGRPLVWIHMLGKMDGAT